MSVLNKVNVVSSLGYDCKICKKLDYRRQENIAGVFSTYAHSWLTSGPDLFIVNNNDGVLQSYWTFGENVQDDLEITCAVELPMEGCAIPLLILGIGSENTNLISFFNPNTRKIIRTIDVNYPVRTICVVEYGTNEVNPLNDALTHTEGLIAVGCAEGTVLLIDLCRSILYKAINGDFRYCSTEDNPSHAIYVEVDSVSSCGFQQQIIDSREKYDSISVILTDPSDEGITALLYSAESAVLFVGTSTGSFHLWNISNLTCLFKSPATSRAIISLSLLEPCDDPRHNLYLWICFEEYAQVAMYSISFSSKYFVHGYGVYYQNFESATLAYRFTLGLEVHMIAKRPINSQAVAKVVPKNLVRCISLPEAEGTQLRLFVTAYEIVDKGQISVRAVIFDLNQWYRDQMPEEGISSCVDSIDLDTKTLWHMQLDPRTLTLYQCVRPQEQHFHPTSFDFQVWCIEDEGIRCLEKLGLQTQWLRNMSRMGSKALLEPTRVFMGALAAGLLPSFIDPPDPEANSQVEERSYVLTICLENRAIVVIEDCAKEWNNGSHTVRGCTIQYLLDWLWGLHRAYKSNGNKICIPLFDQSGMKFDISEKRTLQHCKSLLNTVQSVYTNIVNKYSNIIITGVKEKLTAMSLVRLYFDCCLKLISVNLLPEPNELGKPSGSVIYLYNSINAYVNNRRKEGPFLGDNLIGKTDAESQWEEEGGTCYYPPPSIQSVLRFCLHPSPSLANKMSLILYLFMDIINSYTPLRSQLELEKIKNFQHLMRISEVQFKIVAGCWYLDHSIFEDGVDLLLDPRVLSVDLSEDHHRDIITVLVSKGQEKLALQYLRLKSPSLHLAEDLRMELNLLLSNHLVNEAFLLQRKHPEMREALLIEFFQGCIERKQLGQVFGLNLDLKEESILMKYLKTSGLREKGDLQVLLLLSKAKYTEAMYLNDRLNSTINRPKSRIETDTRDMIVRGITGSLTSISRNMAHEMKIYRPPPSGTYPQPLSTLIKVRNGPDGPLCQTDSNALLCAVAKSTRHLSDFVNSFESGHRRKREEEEDMDVDFEDAPSRKRLKLCDAENNVNKLPAFGNKKWVSSPFKPSTPQERDVMELVGTPLVKKRGKRFSPQSRPSSILKGKTPEKSMMKEELGETPRKSIRFALPENEIQVTARKPIHENEIHTKGTLKVTIENENETSGLALEKMTKSNDLRKCVSARKPLHGEDSINNVISNTNTDLGSTSVIETIKDRLRSSTKKKMFKDGINWSEVAEAAKPRVLFTQGVNKTPSIVKSVSTTSFSTPLSQVLLDITVTSAEKKYLDSPSRGEETSPVTEALFNTTILPTKSFPPYHNDKESGESLEKNSTREAFLKRYKQLRNNSNKEKITEKIATDSIKLDLDFSEICQNEDTESKQLNSFNMPKTEFKEQPELEVHETYEGLQDKQAFGSTYSKSGSSTKFVNQDIKIDVKKLNNTSPFIADKSKEGKILTKDNEFQKQKLIQRESALRIEPLLKDKVEYKSLQDNENVEKHDCKNATPHEDLYGDELQNKQVSLQSGKFISDIASSQSKDQLTKDDNLLCNQIIQNNEQNQSTSNLEEKTEWSDLKLTKIVGNATMEEYYNTFKENAGLEKGTDLSHTDISEEEESNNEEDEADIEDELQVVNNNENPITKEESQPLDLHDDVGKLLNADLSGVNSVSLKETDEVIDIATDDEDIPSTVMVIEQGISNLVDSKHSTDDETDELSESESTDDEEDLEEETSEEEENDSDESENEGSLEDDSSISSDQDEMEKSDESYNSVDDAHSLPCKTRDQIERTDKNVKLDPVVICLDDSEDADINNQNNSESKDSVEDTESETKKDSDTDELCQEEISDVEVFGLNHDINVAPTEENCEDDIWAGLDSKETCDNRIMENEKTDEFMVDNRQEREISQESEDHNDLDNQRALQQTEFGDDLQLECNIENESIDDAESTSYNQREEVLYKGPMITAISSIYGNPKPVIEYVTTLDEENMNELCSDDSDINLEDFKTIEKNWTQEIENEMEQDILLTEKDAGNLQLADDANVTSSRDLNVLEQQDDNGLENSETVMPTGSLVENEVPVDPIDECIEANIESNGSKGLKVSNTVSNIEENDKKTVIVDINGENISEINNETQANKTLDEANQTVLTSPEIILPTLVEPSIESVNKITTNKKDNTRIEEDSPQNKVIHETSDVCENKHTVSDNLEMNVVGLERDLDVVSSSILSEGICESLETISEEIIVPENNETMSEEIPEIKAPGTGTIPNVSTKEIEYHTLTVDGVTANVSITTENKQKTCLENFNSKQVLLQSLSTEIENKEQLGNKRENSTKVCAQFVEEAVDSEKEKAELESCAKSHELTSNMSSGQIAEKSNCSEKKKELKPGSEVIIESVDTLECNLERFDNQRHVYDSELKGIDSSSIADNKLSKNVLQINLKDNSQIGYIKDKKQFIQEICSENNLAKVKNIITDKDASFSKTNIKIDSTDSKSLTEISGATCLESKGDKDSEQYVNKIISSETQMVESEIIENLPSIVSVKTSELEFVSTNQNKCLLLSSTEKSFDQAIIIDENVKEISGEIPKSPSKIVTKDLGEIPFNKCQISTQVETSHFKIEAVNTEIPNEKLDLTSVAINLRYSAPKKDRNQGEELNQENITLSDDNNGYSDSVVLDSQLNNAIMDISNDSFSAGILVSQNQKNHNSMEYIGTKNVSKTEEINPETISGAPKEISSQKSFFFGKEDIDTYIRSTKATFQVGSRVSLPDEDEPVDPMEIAMIETEDKLREKISPTEPEIDLTLHLSPDHIEKPKKVDQGTVTVNSYLQQRAKRMLNMDRKMKLLTNENCYKEIKDEINTPSVDDAPKILNFERECKCISTQTSESVLDNIELSEAEDEEAVPDINRHSKSSQSHTTEQKMKEKRKIRQSSEPPGMYKDVNRRYSLRRKNSESSCDSDIKLNQDAFTEKRQSRRLLQEVDMKGILKNRDSVDYKKNYVDKDFIAESDSQSIKSSSLADAHQYKKKNQRLYLKSQDPDLKETKTQTDSEQPQLIRRSRRLSVQHTESNDLLKQSTNEKFQSSCGVDLTSGVRIHTEEDTFKHQRKSRGYSEDPDLYRISSYKDKGKESNPVSERADVGSISAGVQKHRKSRRHSEEGEGIVNNPEKVKSKSSSRISDNVDKASSKLSSEREDFSLKTKKISEEPENLTVYRNNYKPRESLKNVYSSSSTCENRVKDDVQQDTRSKRHSEVFEIQGLNKEILRSSHSVETCNEFKLRQESYLTKESRKLRRHSEEPELRGILKKRTREGRKSSHTSETASELNYLDDNYPVDGKKSRMQNDDQELHGILKKGSKECRRSTLHSYVTDELKLCPGEDSAERNRRVRRHSEEPEAQEILKKRSKMGRRNSHSSDEFRLHVQEPFPEDGRQLRSHSEEPHVQGILKKKGKVLGKTSSETDSDLKLHLEEDFPERRRRLTRRSSEPEVQEILKKSNKGSRRSSHTSETGVELRHKLNQSLPGEGRRLIIDSEESEVKGILKKRSSRVRKSLLTKETGTDVQLYEGDFSKEEDGKSIVSDVQLLCTSKSGEGKSYYPGSSDSCLIDVRCDDENEKSLRQPEGSDSQSLFKKLVMEKEHKNLHINKNSLINSLGGKNEIEMSDMPGKKEIQQSRKSLLINKYKDDIDYRIDVEKREKEDLKRMNDSANISKKMMGSQQTEEPSFENKKMRRSQPKSFKEESYTSVSKMVDKANIVTTQEEKNSGEGSYKVTNVSSPSFNQEEPIDSSKNEIKLPNKPQRKTPLKKGAPTIEERKKKVEPVNIPFMPKRLEYSDDEESPDKKKSRSLIDFPIRKNRRLPRPTLEDIKEEDEDIPKKKKKSLDDLHLEEIKKRKTSRKSHISKLVLEESDIESDVTTPELWKKDLTKAKRTTRTQQKLFLMNQQLTSVSDVAGSSTTSSPRRSNRKKEVVESPSKTPTRSSLRLKNKPPNETD